MRASSVRGWWEPMATPYVAVLNLWISVPPGQDRPGACHHDRVLILHLVGRSHRRGAELVAMELAAELDVLGHRNHLLAVGSGHEGATLGELRSLVGSRSQSPAVLLLASRRLRPILRELDPDVVLAHGGLAAQVAALARGRGGPALVWQRIMGLPENMGPVRGAWCRWTLRRVDAVVALTSRLEAEVRALGYQGPVEVIPNARRSGRFEGLDRVRARADLCRELSIPEERALVGLVGHLVAQKDPVVAIEAFARLTDGGTDAHLVVVGSGPLADEVRRTVDRHGLAHRVSLVGHVDQVERILAGVDLLWLTSRDEGIPGVLVEAAMAGCPVVTYPVGDVAEVVEHDETGLVLGSAHPEELVDATVGLLMARRRLMDMGERARRRSRRLAMEVVVHDYVAVFDGIVVPRPTAPEVAD